jgi:hypothetical protein
VYFRPRANRCRGVKGVRLMGYLFCNGPMGHHSLPSPGAVSAPNPRMAH